jgi:chromosome segregation ATPase
MSAPTNPATETIRKLKEKITTLKTQLQTEKGNSMLMQSQCDETVRHEKELLKATRSQLEHMAHSHSAELQHMGRKLEEKNTELEKLTERVADLSAKLSRYEDEILQLKLQPGNPVQSEERLNQQQGKPNVLLIGTSNIKNIKEDKLSGGIHTMKIVKTTLDDTMKFILE